jgi:CheY-specific phosphatase CheX
MFIESQQIGEAIGRMHGDSCVELLEAYGVALVPGTTGWNVVNGAVLSAVIGFVGPDVRGTCLLATTDSLLQSCCPAGAALRDWVGELSNQLVGRLKLKLLEREVDIAVTTPLAFSAVQVIPRTSGPLNSIVFTSPVGPMLVSLELEVREGFVLSERVKSLDTRLGDMLFFD